MSGIEVAGLVFGVVPILFKATIEGWRALDDALTFDDNVEDLAIRLEAVKARFGIWAARVGLTQGDLIPSLVPLEELLKRTLERIHDVVVDAERQGTKYGMASNEPKNSDPRKISAAITQMRLSLRSAISSTKSSITLRDSMKSLSMDTSGKVRGAQNQTGISRRLYWVVHDKGEFENFIDILEKHVRNLELLTAESDRKQIQQEGTRLALDIINGISQPEALAQLRRASGWADGFAQIDVGALAHWKSIAVQRASTFGHAASGAEDWSLAGSTSQDRLKYRFLKKGTTDDEAIYLFEKKEYDLNISDDLKDVLRERVRKLVSLLSGSGSARKLNTLQAVGYVDDPDYNCWWTVFRFPHTAMSALELTSTDPLSLNKLLSSHWKPPLETRYRLAKRLVDTFSWLFGAGWMHKGINSNNIIFPIVFSEQALAATHNMPAALVQGFNYSRQLTQSQTIDRGKTLNDLESAIYRHPKYQGEAASGYEIHYDIYSLGLVLLEIALWSPLIDFLKPRKERNPALSLSPDMKVFHETEAVELKRRATIRIDQELAYRVGTIYKDIVKWCLNLDGPVTALEFFNVVAVPLDSLCNV